MALTIFYAELVIESEVVFRASIASALLAVTGTRENVSVRSITEVLLVFELNVR